MSSAGKLGWGLVLRRQGREDHAKRTRDAGLAALGILAGLCWWNLGAFHFGHYLHLADHYHYFLGAKYYTELGHERLYECTAIADTEEGLEQIVRQRRIRDMRSNRLVSTAAVLADPDDCKSRFTPARWDAFKRDVAWFRAAMPPPRWERTFVDHGYNAPPAWGILGSTLSKMVVATDTTIVGLALIDPLLLLVMALLWFYFTFAEFLTTYYGSEPSHMTVFMDKVTGQYAPMFWTMVATLPDGTVMNEGGTSADVVRRQTDGTWKVLVDQPRGEPVAA